MQHLVFNSMYPDCVREDTVIVVVVVVVVVIIIVIVSLPFARYFRAVRRTL
jgi:hypothetical protein